MTTPVAIRTAIGINPSVLRWAREWRGRTVAEVAKRFKKQESVVIDWESGLTSPTVIQARELAEFYERPFLEFFLDAPPVVPISDLVPDYRLHPGVQPNENDRDLQFLQQWAETKRLEAIGLCNDLGVEIPTIPRNLFVDLSSEPEVVAARCREALNFSIQQQIALSKADARSLPTILREKLEALGALTLRRPELKQFGARGICIAKFPLPVIVVQSEAATAQAFTLIHELGHILLGQSGITGERRQGRDKQPVEAWCDRFAASFLMPIDQVTALVGPSPLVPAEAIQDGDLDRIADIFRVSPHAMLIRLVHLGYVQESYYWNVRKPLFDKEEGEARTFGRASYYGIRYRSQHGDFFTGLVLEAWSSGRITNHNAAEYLGMKNVRHLDEIRDNFTRP